ncbi:MAG TPA: helix-turn-helix domain-containing protein [Streptosporangiaceae bacterium]|jgi:DNA-binding HxlR family transcriptional regulator
MTGRLNPRSGWTASACSLARTLEVVSNRSCMLILREAFYGTSRFDDFADRVGISEPVAAARLRELVDAGLLTREPYREPGQRTRLAYRLTDKGADLLPALVALMQWGDRWLAPTGAPVVYRHHGCGAIVHAELSCAAGHAVGGDELELATGPGSRSSTASSPAAPHAGAPHASIHGTGR